MKQGFCGDINEQTIAENPELLRSFEAYIDHQGRKARRHVFW